MNENPYAPPKGEPEPLTTKSADPRRLASLGKRLGASMIDAFVAFPIGVVISHLYAGMTGAERTALVIQMSVLVPFAAQWMLVSQRGQTLGKMLLRTRIVLLDGRLPGFVHGVALRWWPLLLVGFLPKLTSPTLQPFSSLVMVADMLFIFAAGHRCLHDRVAGTVVVDVS